MSRARWRSPACALAGVLVVANTALLGVALLGVPSDVGTLRRGTTYAFDHRGLSGSVVDAITLNGGAMDAFIGAIRGRREILFVATSESDRHANLACFVNGLGVTRPWITLAKGGLSPIHASVLMARTVARGTPIPPTIYLVNPIYFSGSHDRIDDGWLSQVVRTTAFLRFDDWGLQNLMTHEATALLSQHLDRYRWLTPLTYQAHLAHRLYLKLHAETQIVLPPVEPRRCRTAQAAPVYDVERNVESGYTPRDAWLAGRWNVQPADRSVNLAGLRNLVHVWRRVASPLLLLVIPPNRRFYAAAGLDMAAYDANNNAHFDAIDSLATSYDGPGQVMIANLARHMELSGGYGDRMHPNAIGNLQMAAALLDLPAYRSFVDEVARYYAAAR